MKLYLRFPEGAGYCYPAEAELARKERKPLSHFRLIADYGNSDFLIIQISLCLILFELPTSAKYLSF